MSRRKKSDILQALSQAVVLALPIAVYLLAALNGDLPTCFSNIANAIF